MSLRVIGAGLARTGTTSLKLALEQLLDRPVYHWREMISRPAHVTAWHEAVHGRPPIWRELLDPYGAAVSVPASAFWRELSEANPDALIILSTRDDPEQWWKSLNGTLLTRFRQPAPAGSPMARAAAMAVDLWQTRIGAGDINDKDAMIAAYERHNQQVRAQAAPGRLLDWRPSDGWEPIAAALGRSAPDAPFPWENTHEQFHARTA